jgi:predicted GIY-YIG superfamily endonuclease
MTNPRRAQPQVSLTATGVLYLLHFHDRLGTERHPAQHYLGFTPDLESRIEKHRAGQGARITQVLRERGIGFDVVAVWPGNRQIENALKLHSATRICPRCTPNPRVPLIIRKAIEAEEQRQARGTQQRSAAKARSAYHRGADLAERFIRDQVLAGRTAEQIAAAHAYITGPGHQRAHSTQAQAETFRGYSEMVTAALTQLREDPAARPREAKRPGARRWLRRRVAEREDGLPQNADGSLSRSRTTDAQKDTAGVMTAAQQREHTALRRGAYGRVGPELRGRVQRITAAEAARRPDPWAAAARQAQPARQREMEPEAG